MILKPYMSADVVGGATLSKIRRFFLCFWRFKVTFGGRRRSPVAEPYVLAQVRLG
jgi:hypothetical protein